LKATSEDSSGPWLSRLETLAGRVTQKAIADRSRKYGTDWFDSESADTITDFDEV
jgi:hypothetical protein